MRIQNNLIRAFIFIFWVLVYPMTLIAYDEIGELGFTPGLVDAKDPLGPLRIDVLTDSFMVLPKPPCKGVEELLEEATLKNICEKPLKE